MTFVEGALGMIVLGFIAFVLGFGFAMDGVSRDCDNLNLFLSSGQIFDCHKRPPTQRVE
jgi:hypothetical protein